MAQRSLTSYAGSWLLSAILLAAGGAGFVLLVLWLAQAILGLLSGRLVPDAQTGLTVLAASFGAAGIIGLWLLRTIFRRPGRRALLIVVIWILGHLVLWRLSLTFGRVTLPLYAGFWIAVGVLGGLGLALLPAPTAGRRERRARGGSGTRAKEAVVRTSQFGRIPSETVVLLTRQVKQVEDAVKGGLPGEAPPAVRDASVGAILERTLRDWWGNGNTAGLMTQDIADLRSFVAAAAGLAERAGIGTPEGQAVYRATLTALLDDWLFNWNAHGVSGPPRREY